MDQLRLRTSGWKACVHRVLQSLRQVVVLGLIPYLLFTSSSAAATLAIVYPEVPAPYKQVFEQIIEGIQIRHQGPLIKYPIDNPIEPEQLLHKMSSDKVDMVVTLGRRGLTYNKSLQGQLPFVTGALPIKPNGISGVSLIADPGNLFEQLHQLAPGIRRIHVVYTDKTQWLIDKADSAAKNNKLELVTYKATDIKQAIQYYEQIFKQAEQKTDSIWLPLDAVTANEKVILPLLLRESWDRNLVVFSSKPSHVKRGFLFTLFPDSLKDGERLAEMLDLMFHKGKTPGVELSNSQKVGVNLRTASHLGLEYSQQMKSSFYQTFPQQGF